MGNEPLNAKWLLAGLIVAGSVLTGAAFLLLVGWHF